MLIRRLTILLLIVGCVFGDTIKYKSSLFVTDTKNNVEFLGTQKKKVFYKTKEGNIESLSCKLVKEITDTSNNTIVFDCDRTTYRGSNLTTNEPKQYTFKPSGAAIAIGATLVYTSIDNEDANPDKLLARRKMGFGLIIIGGILASIGQ